MVEFFRKIIVKRNKIKPRSEVFLLKTNNIGKERILRNIALEANRDQRKVMEMVRRAK